jgi:hypothetical protein
MAGKLGIDGSATSIAYELTACNIEASIVGMVFSNKRTNV